MINLIINGHTYRLPENWDELTRPQVLKLCQALSKGYYTEQAYRLALLCALLPVEHIRKQLPKYPKSARKHQVKKRSIELVMEELLREIDFSWVAQLSEISENVLKFVEIEDKVYRQKPLQGGYMKISLLEMSYAHFYLFSYAHSKEKEYLYKLFATLYQRGAAFDPAQIVKNFLKFAQVPPLLRQLMLAYINQAFKKYFTRFEDTVFAGQEKGEAPRDAATPPKPPDWNGVIINLTKQGFFGTLKETQETELLSALLVMERQIKEARKPAPNPQLK